MHGDCTISCMPPSTGNSVRVTRPIQLSRSWEEATCRWILTSGDRAFSELYILRGRIAQHEGHILAARAEFQRAVYYNTNMKEARDALAAVAH